MQIHHTVVLRLGDILRTLFWATLITPLLFTACRANETPPREAMPKQSAAAEATTAPLLPAPKFTEILNTPQQYDGRRLRVSCYYFEAFEYVVLCRDVIANDSGYYQVKDGKIWASWKTVPPSQEIESRLRSVQGRTGPNYYGPVEVVGIFHVRPQSGHLGEFNYLFEIEEMRFLEVQ